MSSSSEERTSSHRVTALSRFLSDIMCTTVVVGVGTELLSAASSSGKALSALNILANGVGVFCFCRMTDRWLTLAAGGAVVPVAWETVLTVTTSSTRAARTAVGERMAGGTSGSWPTFTPPTALTAGETRVACLDYMNEKHYYIPVSGCYALYNGQFLVIVASAECSCAFIAWTLTDTLDKIPDGRSLAISLTSHWSQSRPVTPGLQWHTPVLSSHEEVPHLLHSHSLTDTGHRQWWHKLEVKWHHKHCGRVISGLAQPRKAYGNPCWILTLSCFSTQHI